MDYHVHSLGHAAFRPIPAEIAPFLECARQRGIAEIGLADHDRYAAAFDWRAVRETAATYPEVTVRFGVEVDYRSGGKPAIRALLGTLPRDFATGSVHNIGEWNFDHPDHRDGFDRYDPDELYRIYFGEVAACAASGLFQIIGHLDLIKIWGHRPRGDVVALAGVALRAIAGAGAAVELSTAGLRRPVAETYPSLPLLQEAYRMNIPLTLSSDAHRPEEVGQEIDLAARIARQAGYRTVTGFSHCRSRQVEL